MAASKKPSRAEARARRIEREAAVTANRVYGCSIEDAMAQTWRSQVIVFASSPGEARATFQHAGFFKRNSAPIEAEKLSGDEFSFAAAQPLQVFLRRRHDFGWSRWYPLPPGYVHPPKNVAARDASAGRLPGEPLLPADEFTSRRWRPSPLRDGEGVRASDSDF